MDKGVGFLDYIKKAFYNHWNLLAFGGGVAAGIISGRPDILLPLVTAGELIYLAGLASHPKFQAHVQAQAHKTAKARVEGPALQQIFAMLDHPGRARFEELRMRCRNLQSLAQGIRPVGVNSSVASLHLEGINRLLWVFLKLLYSKQTLEQFLSRTDEIQIQQNMAEIQNKIEKLGPPEEDTAVEIKMRKTLQDTLNSATLRLENLAKAKDNYEYIKLELERIDSKITSIAELAVNRQDPGFITSEVDGVTATMAQTEQAMSDLQFLSGLGEENITPPEFLDERIELH